MENIKKLITEFLCAVLYVCILVVAISWSFALAVGGIEIMYWIVTGTFFHLIPVG